MKSKGKVICSVIIGVLVIALVLSNVVGFTTISDLRNQLAQVESSGGDDTSSSNPPSPTVSEQLPPTPSDEPSPVAGLSGHEEIIDVAERFLDAYYNFDSRMDRDEFEARFANLVTPNAIYNMPELFEKYYADPNDDSWYLQQLVSKSVFANIDDSTTARAFCICYLQETPMEGEIEDNSLFTANTPYILCFNFKNQDGRWLINNYTYIYALGEMRSFDPNQVFG